MLVVTMVVVAGSMIGCGVVVANGGFNFCW